MAEATGSTTTSAGPSVDMDPGTHPAHPPHRSGMECDTSSWCYWRNTAEPQAELEEEEEEERSDHIS